MTDNAKRTARGAVKSKTNWLGVAVVALSYAQANQEQIEQYIDPYYLPLFGFVLGGAIIVVRFFTSQPLSEK